jgi:hypothetical protein
MKIGHLKKLVLSRRQAFCFSRFHFLTLPKNQGAVNAPGRLSNFCCSIREIRAIRGRLFTRS